MSKKLRNYEKEFMLAQALEILLKYGRFQRKLCWSVISQYHKRGSVVYPLTVEEGMGVDDLV